MSKHPVIDLISKIKSLNGRDALNAIMNAAHDRLDYVNRIVARDIRRGEKVEFESRRSGPMQGIVKKVNIKYVVVDIDKAGMAYRVPASMLRKVA